MSYYDILGVSKDATLEEIKEKYNAKVKKLHPDKVCTCLDVHWNSIDLLSSSICSIMIYIQYHNHLRWYLFNTVVQKFHLNSQNI